MIIKTLVEKITKNEFSTNKETRDNFIRETLEKNSERGKDIGCRCWRITE
jgi:hypothetical protein